MFSGFLEVHFFGFLWVKGYRILEVRLAKLLGRELLCSCFPLGEQSLLCCQSAFDQASLRRSPLLLWLSWGRSLLHCQSTFRQTCCLFFLFWSLLGERMPDNLFRDDRGHDKLGRVCLCFQTSTGEDIALDYFVAGVQ